MNVKCVACASALYLVAGQSVAEIYPVSVNTTLQAILFGTTVSIPASGTGFYDDVTGEGSWNMTLDLTSIDFGPIVFDQNWTMDSQSGEGILSSSISHCIGSSMACSVFGQVFSGPWSASPVPVASGRYTYSLVNLAFGILPIEVVNGSEEPAVRVTLNLPTANYECLDGGALVEASSTVDLINDAQLESVVWKVDGQLVASTESFSDYLPLGLHTLEIVATITTGDQASALRHVRITDTENPVITAFFTDSRTGEVITSIDTKNTSFVQSNFGATDACDTEPNVQGFGGFALTDGQTLKIQGNQDKVELNASALEMFVKATDASGNSSEETKTLSISN